MCALLASAASRWQVTQLVCVVFQLYAVTAGVPVVMLVPLLWQTLVPQAPNVAAAGPHHHVARRGT